MPKQDKVFAKYLSGSMQIEMDVQLICETKKKILMWTIGHQQDSLKGKWDNSGATEHTLTCHEQFNWIQPKTIERLLIGKAKYDKHEKLRKENTTNKKIKVLNRDEVNLVKTIPLALLFAKVNDLLRDLVQLKIIAIENICKGVLHLA